MDSAEQDTGCAVAPPEARRASPRPAPAPRVEQPRAWNVVLLDDDHHSYEYVVALMRQVFGRPPAEGWSVAQRVDRLGRAVCLTTHREHAELKQEQVHGFGADPRIASCAGSMSAVLEPADADPDERA